MSSMNRWLVALLGCFWLLFAAGGAAAAQDQQPPVEGAAKAGAGAESLLTLKVPLFSPRFSKVPVAVVNDEPIILEEFIGSLVSMHKDRPEQETRSRKDFGRALQRLVNIKLIVLEARTMGMDDLPELKELLTTFSEAALQGLLRDRVKKNVKADEAEVERLYRESIREYKLRSVMFQSEGDARNMVAAIAAGGDYGELSAKAVAEGRARGSKEAEHVKTADLLPEVRQAVSSMKPGGLSKPIPIKPGFVVLKLDDVRSTESPEARDRAYRQALEAAQAKALVEYNEALSRKYLKDNTKLIKSLTFEPEKMEALLKDKRVIVQVKGDSPITVGDLASQIEKTLYHGASISTKAKITKRKMDALERLRVKRMLLAEAKKQGLDESDEFRKFTKNYEETMLFGLFVEKAVKPGAKLKWEEVQAYYDKHRDEYLSSPRMRIEGFTFLKESDAQNALDRILRGTDLQWLRKNAAGQAVGGAPGAVEFGEDFMDINDLPGELRAVLSGARPGDARLAVGPQGYVYVLVVHDVRSPEILPIEEVKHIIERKVYDAKIEAAIDEWAAKVKPAYDVKVFLSEDQQDSLHETKLER